MTDLMERKQADLDRLTVAIANGYVLSMSPEAQAEWRTAHAKPTAASEEQISKQSASLARLARLFPGAVKPKVN